MVRAAASTSKSCQSANVVSEMVTMPADPTKTATPEMVTMPAGQANGAGPSKPVFHPGLGVEGVILPPQITSELRQSAKSAAVPPAGARTGRSFAQIAKERILIGVLDRGNLEGGIPRSQWRWVESALAIHCFNLLEREPGPPPICKDVGWFQGNIKVIACDDNRSAELYKAAVARVGAGAAPEDVAEVQSSVAHPRLAGGQNRGDTWAHSPGFGFSSVFIRVYKSDAAVGGAPSGKPAEEDITAELEAPERPEMDGYISDASSLTRDLRKLWQAGDLEVTSDLASEDEDADITVVECGLCGSTTPSGWRRSGRGPNPGTLDGVRNEDNTTVSLELQLAPIRLLSAYMAYDHVGPLPDDFTRDLIRDCDKNKIALLIGCDANAHHTQWGSSNTNVRAFLDIEGAFNNVFPDAITGALTGLGVEGRLVGLINQLLTSRAVTSTLGSSTLTREEWADKPPGKTGALTFYTDGSKLKNQVGGGVFSQHLGINHSFRLPDHYSVFQAEIWQTSLVGRVARQTWPYIEKARTDALCNLSRRDCSLVVRSMTGHWLIGTHAHRLNFPYNNFCRSCRDEEEEESPEHFFCSCPALSNRRLRTLGKPFLDDLSGLSAIPPRKIALFIQSSNWTPF
ncbi:hypothetical protein ACLKA7_005588 [Drosophila subpalustris]